MIRLKRVIKRSLLKFFYRKLWVRIAIILFAIVTIPIVLLGALLIDTSQKAVRNSVLNNYQQIAFRTAQEIGLFVKGPQDILNSTAAMLGVVYPAPWKQETILVELVLQQPILMRATSVDFSGNELASSEIGRGFSWDYPKEALESAAKGKSYVSKVSFLDNHTPFVTMAVPIKKMGRGIGVLISDVNLRGVWEIVDNIRIGKTGSVFLVSQEGTLIAHQDKKRVLRNENLKGRKEVQSVVMGRSAAIESEDKLEGKWIIAYAPIPGLGWGIVLRQKQDEAYLFSKVMKMQSWVIIILSELAVILVSIFMGRVLALPIKTLASRLKRVAAGDLEHKITVRMRDDIGELIRSFNEMTRKLKAAKERERLSAIGEAVTWITHELKNSFVSIKSFIQLFPRKHKDEKFMDTFSRLMPEETNRLERIFKELADFSSNYELKIVRTNINEIIDSVLEIMREAFIETKISIKYIPSSDNFYIEADPDRLRQVFTNLIINSINAMPSGGALIISIGLASGENLSRTAYVEVGIKDTGEGMTREAQEKIFEPFHTTKNGGMGLGLTISRRIVQEHGGNIRVESHPGEGTTFIVRLPIEIIRPREANIIRAIPKNF